MKPHPSSLPITCPYKTRREEVQTTRYTWHNDRRGNDPFVILQWTHEGSGVFTLRGRDHPVPPHHAFLAIIPERSAYRFPAEASEPWVFSWLNFYGPTALEVCGQLREQFGPVLPLPATGRARHALEQLLAGYPGDTYETSAACYSFLMSWAQELSHPALSGGDPVEAALRICSARFREPLAVKELADAVGLTREHFTRLFTETTGQSPARHLRALRLAAARELRKVPGLPQEEIALRSGFPSAKALRRALQHS